MRITAYSANVTDANWTQEGNVSYENVFMNCIRQLTGNQRNEFCVSWHKAADWMVTDSATACEEVC